jgi:hypothetical protein
MATDGADFKRRVKYHGRTYTEIKNGSDLETISDVSVAGLARELAGDNPLHGFKELVLATADCLQSVFARDSQTLLCDLSQRLSKITAGQACSEAQRIAVESLIRAAGALRQSAVVLDSQTVEAALLSTCGRDLHDAFVIGFAEQYAMEHRQLGSGDLPLFVEDWKRAASGRLNDLMVSIFKDGRPAKELLRPRPELARVQSDSLSDLTSINLGS